MIKKELLEWLRNEICHCDVLYGVYCGHREKISYIMEELGGKSILDNANVLLSVV